MDEERKYLIRSVLIYHLFSIILWWFWQPHFPKDGSLDLSYVIVLLAISVIFIVLYAKGLKWIRLEDIKLGVNDGNKTD